MIKFYKTVKYLGILLTSIAGASGSGYMLWRTWK